MPVSKRTKAKWAEEALIAYATLVYAQPVREVKHDPTLVIEEFLVDLRHYCDERALCYGVLDKVAYRTYVEELGTEIPEEELGTEIPEEDDRG